MPFPGKIQKFCPKTGLDSVSSPCYPNCTRTVNTVCGGPFRRRREGEAMISLNYRDSRPIYEQIKDGLRKLIVTGAMAPDEKLPSVRALATQLSINPNTIQRAYELLEAEGYVSSVPGKGSFAAPHHQVDSARRDGLLRVFDDTATELMFLGLSADTLSQRLTNLGGVRP